jgi:ICP0-binding domain of Ubiquitin-specific protease 7
LLKHIILEEIKFDYGIWSIVRIELFDLMFLFLLILTSVFTSQEKGLIVAIEGWVKNSTTKGEFRLYMEKAADIWHPTVAILPKRPIQTPILPVYTEEPKDLHSTQSSGNSSQSLSNGDVELESANGTPKVEWPEVGRLPGLYNARHDATMILIFLKWFDVDSQCIRGQSPIYVNRHDKTGKLTPIIAEMMGWKAETGDQPVNIALYEEIKPGMIEPLKPNSTFLASEIQDGDIICFMRGQTPKRYFFPPLEGNVIDF